MKKFRLITILVILTMSLISCGDNGTEETKMISSDAVKKSGEHSNFLSVDADSVKIMLVKIDKNEWEIRALLPLTNEQHWENVPGTDPTADSYYEPSMGNMTIEFLDANGTPLDLNLQVDYDVIKSLLCSNEYKTEDLVITEYWSGTYDEKKKLFDKITGISIKKMDLSKSYNHSGSYSNSSSDVSYNDSDYEDEDEDVDDEGDDDWEDVKEAIKTTKAAYKTAKAAYKTAKELDEADEDDWDW